MNLADKYKKLEGREHVLTRPGMYIGSIDEDTCVMWVYDVESNKVVKRDIKYIAGLYKIFDEILVNAIDQCVRLKSRQDCKHPLKTIKVNIDKDTGIIEVLNDGEGIEIEKHPDHDIYIPELIFGNLLTSTNYDDSEEKIIGGQNGIGAKCISLDTMVPLFNGDIKMAQDVKVGDVLVGDDGKERTVLGVTNGKGKMYQILQSMGETYKVNDQHTLTLHMPDHKIIFWSVNGWKILWWNREKKGISAKFIKACDTYTTCSECGVKLASSMKRHFKRCHSGSEVPCIDRKTPCKNPDMSNEDVKCAFLEMQRFAQTIDDNNVIDITIEDYMSLPKTTQKRLAGVRGKCIDWDYKPVDLDPYVLGLWLGDGVHHGYSYICDGENDPELIDYLTQWGKENDAKLRKTGKYTYGISSISSHGKKYCAPLRKALLKYNLVKNKHIPKDYLINSRDVRLRLLAGLIDTDGSVSRDGTRIHIVQGAVHKDLIYDIQYLARSLGFYCTLRSGKAKYKYNGMLMKSDIYRLNISGNVDDIPTNLPRKKCRNTKSINTDMSTGQLTIRDMGNDEYIGFQIDGNHRFLINDFTVTHNCCNIFSTFFEIETVDAVRKKLYKQRFEDNMSKINAPVIEKYGKKPYTCIRFCPDYKRFSQSGLSKDMYELMIKRVYDVCAVTESEVSVYLNGNKLEYKNFEAYANLYIGDKSSHSRVYEKVNDRWEIVASYNDFNGFEHVSFVNGVWTSRGGKHVEYVVNNITKRLIEIISKKKKDVNIKPQVIKDNLIVFVKSTIVNPSFDSQSKETLTTPASKFGSKAELSDKFYEKLAKTGIIERILEISQVADANTLKKTDGKKRSLIKGIHKLDDANWAGTGKSGDCVLILTEGDSAKTMAISGLSEVGRDRYGVFPLRGKLMNVKDVNVKKLTENEEISNLKKIIGLETGKDYIQDKSTLRYGRILIMTDQDTDGSHIKGLIFNMFQTLWPSLLRRNDFMTSMITPIVKVKKGTNNVISFYSLTDYENWKRDNNDGKGWDIKYYKGLGTSDSKEAKEYFRNLNVVSYLWNDTTSDNAIDLAFNKKRADDRKAWLGNYDRQNIVDFNTRELTYDEFVNKDLIHFSNYDIERSIPSICDGLKISQRKILYAGFKKNLVDKEIKVAQFCGYVMEQTSYHHGDASLQAAIVGMAQDFVGSNNINLYQPIGQFGTRIQGGKDAGQPRYINTMLSEITSKIFIKSDQAILKYLNDDGFDIEPEFYVPIIPMILVNGAIGIGTGFSTAVPCYNPMDIIGILERMLEGNDEEVELVPWYRDFTGTIKKVGGKWASCGRFSKTSATKLEVHELPIGYWTEDFKVALEEYYDKNPAFKSYESYYDEKNVHFVLNFTNAAAVDALMKVDNNGHTVFENEFKLISSKNMNNTNMYLFNEQGQIKKYESAFDIVKEFYGMRLRYYEKRKAYLLEQLVRDNALIENKIRFIKAVVVGDVVIQKLRKAELEKYLEDNNYMKNGDNYDYIVRIPIYNLTIDKVEELEEEYTKKFTELQALMQKDIKDMWKEELSDIKQHFVKEDRGNTKPAPVIRGRKKKAI